MKRFSSTVSLVAPLCILSVASVGAIAETKNMKDSGNSENPMDEIVVTATHTGETDLQETPIAITVHSEKSLEEHGIENVRDLVRVTPGLSISQNSDYAHIFIRGVGSNNSFLGSDPSSTLYVDGVYIGRPLSLFTDFLGVDRIEVLRGPQGVLYGRNSTGGAINVISATPENDNFYKAKIGYGSFDERKVNLFGNIAINSGISANLAINRELRDGYVDNKGGDDLVDKDTKGARGAIKINDSNGVELIIRGDYLDRDETGAAYKTTYQSINNTIAAETVTPVGLTPQVISDFHTVNVNSPTFHKSTQKGASLELNVDLGDNLTLTYIPARRSSNVEFQIDSDWSDLNILTSHFVENQDQVSNELRFLKNGDNFSIVFGGYLLSEDAESVFTLNGNPIIDGNLQTESRAAFLNGQYFLSEALSMSLGARISQEEKHYTSSTSDETKSWTDMTPRIGIEYAVNDDVFLYSSISEGFKSGGFNFSTKASFDPEHITSYEIGAKTYWFDKTVGLNTSMFYYDYKDLQVSSFVQNTGTSQPVVFIDNAAEANIVGLEVEFSVVPNDMWDITGSFAYLNAEYDKYLAARSATATAVVDAEGNDLNHAPELKMNIDFGFHHPFAQGEVNYLLSTYWQDKEYFTAFNDELTSQDSYGLVDLRVAYRHADDTWEVAVFGRNLGDKEYSNTYVDYPPTGVALNIMPPRTFGIEFSYQSL